MQRFNDVTFHFSFTAAIKRPMSKHRIGIIGGSGLYSIEGFYLDQKMDHRQNPFRPALRPVPHRPPRRARSRLPAPPRPRPPHPAQRAEPPRQHLGHEKTRRRLAHQRQRRWLHFEGNTKPCDIVAIDQFIDRTKRDFEHTFFGRGIVGHIAFADPICGELQQLLVKSARALGARVHDGGAYVNMEGPAFSTRAESISNHKLGYDVIGMTNLGEAKCCREAEIAYATLAMITDYDCWKVDEAHVTVEMIIANLMKNAAMAKDIVKHVIPRIPAAPAWPCHDALRNAILTDKKLWRPAKTKKELAPICREIPLKSLKSSARIKR